MRGQMMQMIELGVGKQPVNAQSGLPSAHDTHEYRIAHLEQIIQSHETALAKHSKQPEQKLLIEAQMSEGAFAKQAKLQESHLADLQTQMKQYCDTLVKEENKSLQEATSALQMQIDTLRGRVNEHSAGDSKPVMSTVHEQASQEAVSQLEDALEREIAARKEGDANSMRTVRVLLLEQEKWVLQSQAHCEERLRHQMMVHVQQTPRTTT